MVEEGDSVTWMSNMKSIVAYAKAHPEVQGGIRPIYGLAASVPMRGKEEEFLKG